MLDKLLFITQCSLFKKRTYYYYLINKTVFLHIDFISTFKAIQGFDSIFIQMSMYDCGYSLQILIISLDRYLTTHFNHYAPCEIAPEIRIAHQALHSLYLDTGKNTNKYGDFRSSRFGQLIAFKVHLRIF